MREYKIGDKIKILKSGAYSEEIVNYIGTVVNVSRDVIDFTITNTYSNYNTQTWAIRKEHIELYMPKNIVGGRLI